MSDFTGDDLRVRTRRNRDGIGRREYDLGLAHHLQEMIKYRRASISYRNPGVTELTRRDGMDRRVAHE